MQILLPELIETDPIILKRIEDNMKAIHRLVIFSREHLDDDLLDAYCESIDTLRTLLSIKNAQMEAQTEEEIVEYAANLKKTLDFIISEIINQTNFTSPFQIFQLIKLISPDVFILNPNKFRSTVVQVGGYVCPPPEALPSLIEDLFYHSRTIENPIIRAIYTHHELVRIHPFADGNGRLSRMAKNWMLMYDLYPPIFIESKEEKAEYIKSLKNSFDLLSKKPYEFNAATKLFFEQEINRLLINTNKVYYTVFSFSTRNKKKL